MTAADIQSTILAVWRIEQPRLITSLSRMLRDVPLAEDLTQETLIAALEHWPADGIPDKPGAWLMATAKRRALDHLRHVSMRTQKHGMLAHDLAREQDTMPDLDSRFDDDIGDELLRLIFTACHPLLSREDVLITPHMGWTTRGTYERFLTDAGANIRAFVSGRPLRLV